MCLVASILEMIVARQAKDVPSGNDLESKSGISMETKLDEKTPLLGELKQRDSGNLPDKGTPSNSKSYESNLMKLGGSQKKANRLHFTDHRIT